MQDTGVIRRPPSDETLFDELYAVRYRGLLEQEMSHTTQAEVTTFTIRSDTRQRPLQSWSASCSSIGDLVFPHGFNVQTNKTSGSQSFGQISKNPFCPVMVFWGASVAIFQFHARSLKTYSSDRLYGLSVRRDLFHKSQVYPR